MQDVYPYSDEHSQDAADLLVRSAGSRAFPRSKSGSAT